ncbi:hypothetical protein D3C73_829590 [compost metagenome]
MEGPLSAPSSPPETPVPMKRIPLSSSSLLRRTVSGKNEFPPSIRISPLDRRGSNWLIVSSVGLPALTIIKILRGTSKDCTNSSTLYVPTSCLPGDSSSSSFVFSGERLNTETLKPLLSILRARFFPITANPTTPICCLDMFSLTSSL